MLLKREEQEFIVKWDEKRKTKKWLPLKALVVGSGTSALASLGVLVYNRSEVSINYTLINALVLSAFWYAWYLIDYSRNEKKYNSLVRKKNAALRSKFPYTEN